jgi:uncharacterized protein (DUF3084 family)
MKKSELLEDFRGLQAHCGDLQQELEDIRSINNNLRSELEVLKATKTERKVAARTLREAESDKAHAQGALAEARRELAAYQQLADLSKAIKRWATRTNNTPVSAVKAWEEWFEAGEMGRNPSQFGVHPFARWDINPRPEQMQGIDKVGRA